MKLQHHSANKTVDGGTQLLVLLYPFKTKELDYNGVSQVLPISSKLFIGVKMLLTLKMKFSRFSPDHLHVALVTFLLGVPGHGLLQKLSSLNENEAIQ